MKKPLSFMKKSLTFNLRVARLALLCGVAATVAGAQEATSDAWVKVAPPDEAFTVWMPRAPVPLAANGKSGALVVAGQRYALRHDNAEYTVWSFTARKLPASLGDNKDNYLDQCAEIAWNLMIEPYWKKFERGSPDQLTRYNMSLDGPLLSAGHAGRSYSLNLGDERGLTHIYAVGARVYIVAASGVPQASASVERFVKSFALSLPPVPAAPAVADGKGGGRSSNESVSGGAAQGQAQATDHDRTFSMREVTRKAMITAKPKPSYTEWARRFSITGTVRLRVILSAAGTVIGITPLTRLPHGLTQEAIEAVRKIEFIPAEKDGRRVSQYVTIEYNFSIY